MTEHPRNVLKWQTLMSRFFIPTSLLLASAPLLHAADPPLPAKISFNRDIRPIMSDTCFHCHGFDPKTREAGLRLDIREEALKASESGLPGIVPGKPEQSEIITRIFDEGDPMPPEKAHKPLSPRQKALLRQWVAEGAHYEPHWAYAPLTRPAPPAQGHPVDAFVRQKLSEKGIQPSSPAEKSKLARRLSLDLTGLPPSPQSVAAFASGSKSYDDLVTELLASPRFGERMAVWWLDIARYADTVGFHGDQNQRIFPYRDYVINAFNSNKRFDQFTIEQLAGDLLPSPKEEQLVATGYNRLNMMTREGGAQPKEYLAKYGAERVRSVAAAWFGSTFGCAECHDHKFDPIKAQDFYELQAFFADVKQWGVYSDYRYTPEPELAGFNNDFPFPPEMQVKSPYLAKRHEAALAALEQHLHSLRSKHPKVSETWLQSMSAFVKENPSGWLSPQPVAQMLANGKPAKGTSLEVKQDAIIHPAKAPGKNEALEVALPPPESWTVAAVQIEVFEEQSPPEKPVSLAVSLAVRPANGKERKVPFAMADATLKSSTYKDGAEIMGIEGGWTLPGHEQTKPMRSVWLPASPITTQPGDTLVFTFTGSSKRPFRISLSPLAAPSSTATLQADLAAALREPASSRTDAQKRIIHDAWLASTTPDTAAAAKTFQLAKDLRSWNEGRAWTLVTKATDKPLTIRVLPRGNWQDETGPVVLPATPSFLPGRIESTADRKLNRLDLATYIVSKENPITARTVMNRLWQQFFGQGLSAVLDDLGSQGEPPSHPELLDWLASEFRASGWDMKHMIRLLVTSATYQQSSSLRPELKDIDPANRLLASQNPRRLDAEFIRDNALSIAGLLNLDEIGGPSAKPYQPAGYYAALQFPDRDYIADTDRTQWRRGVYMHWQRTFLHPMLANFDAPARDECAAIRTSSNTPQQALTLLNDPTFVEAARVFADRILREGTDDNRRLQIASRLAWSRDPKPKEVQSLTTFLSTQREHYKSNPADADKLIKVGIATASTAPAPELAAWTQVCRVLLNAQETITKY